MSLFKKTAAVFNALHNNAALEKARTYLVAFERKPQPDNIDLLRDAAINAVNRCNPNASAESFKAILLNAIEAHAYDLAHTLVDRDCPLDLKLESAGTLINYLLRKEVMQRPDRAEARALIFKMIDKGIDLHKATANNWNTALQSAIQMQDEDIAIAIIKKGGKKIAMDIGISMRTPLTFCATYNTPRVAQEILAIEGMDIDKPNLTISGLGGITALREALNCGHPDMVSFLLSKGASVTAPGFIADHQLRDPLEQCAASIHAYENSGNQEGAAPYIRARDIVAKEIERVISAPLHLSSDMPVRRPSIKGVSR